ncbi:nestin [Notolabrus celidotus]|uniref:nestin n=1 Tax=Notolabrus celidotus TaxID=1203425 RepID=UPI00148FF38A|nr:nestin [Notolabrus celidotus]XP_034552978.1 nestin [Notolabrus celidotus]
MELFSVHKTFQQSHMGEEKHQMLNLNRRLETYLSRVKHLEEENALLANEIQALRRSSHGALTRRKGLEEELHRGRLEVDAAWRDRVYTEVEVGKMVEELHALDLQRQREAQAQVEAKVRLEKSRKELQEEHRAQVWLREKVSQLENELMHMIQTHEDDVAHLEAKLSLSRSTVPPTSAQRRNQNPNLLELGHEFSQRATMAWQEAAEAYQGQLAQLEESLNHARGRLTQVNQEKSESQLKLRGLEKEIASAQDIRVHLEKTAVQQGESYSQELQELQEHLEGLEAEKEELGQHIEGIILENRGLLQAKMSLGMEVATYRTLLDAESFSGNISRGNTFITDAVFNPHGVKKNYKTQLPVSHKTTSLSSVRGRTGTGQTVRTTTPIWSRKPVTLTETPKTYTKSAYKDNVKSATSETPYPRILQDGAVENFRPQEVQEKVTYAEPLSPPNELEAFIDTPDLKEGEERRSNNTEERPFAESVIQHQVESSLSREPPSKDEVGPHQFDTPNLTPYHVRMKEESSGFSDEPDEEVDADEQDVKEPCSPVAAWEEKKDTDKELEHLQEETSDSETEAVLERTFESRTGSPVSECEPDEDGDESILQEDAAEMRHDISCSTEVHNAMSVEDKLYPDGEEMDTWDSVIERKVELKDDSIKTNEENLKHAEPEEDISAREQESVKRETAVDVQQHDSASSMIDTEVDDDGEKFATDLEHALLFDKEDEEEDSQNVSVSWKTEVESDSYAQDNTLADTRPLIRYKSDETDANTHASHMDESESSEGEQEKKVGETGTGTGTWEEGKSKRFGTMEDLCEEGEVEALDEDYDLGYTHEEGRVVGHDMPVSEEAREIAEEILRNVSEAHWDVGTEELTKPMTSSNVSYDEELEIDRLVEQELENLATDSYSAHFAQQQISKSESVEELTWLGGTGDNKTEDMPSSAETEITSFDSMTAQSFKDQRFSDSSLVGLQKETEETVQHKDQGEEYNTSSVTPTHQTEDQTDSSEFQGMPHLEDISKDPEYVSLGEADQKNLQDVAEEVASVEASQGLPIKEVSDYPEVPETTEWDVLKNPFDVRYQNEGQEKWGSMTESAESFHHTDEDSDQGGKADQEEPVEMSPESVTDDKDIFRVKDSTELSNTNGKDKGVHGFFSSGVQSDFWMSSLETGATYQPEDSRNEAAEQTNKNQGYADSPVWGDLDSPNAVRKNSKVDIDSREALGSEAEQKKIYPEMKQALCRNVEGEFVHSEESDVEGESWSSGEEVEYK